MSEQELAKIYQPNEVEDQIYSTWLNSGAFSPDENSNTESFTIMIPPPNVTGVLHIGHVLNNTIQDVLIRRARMQGKNTLWLPGTDHASIATEAKVTKMLADKGINKKEITRDEFLNHALQWKDKYGGIILKQLKKLGCSCDWDKTVFTMDKKYSNAVLEIFIKLYNDGLIYRGTRMINWDPVGQTALSDEEVIHKEVNGHLWHFKYPIKDTDKFLIVATTRPETMLGDTGIAINPDDERYTHLIGKSVILPLVNREIPIFTDAYVDKEFGTGCVKVTPAHDPNDLEMGKRNNLNSINIMNPNGELNENVPTEFQGVDRLIARKLVVEAMEKLGLLEKIEDHIHQVGHSERTHAVVEPYMSKQWFVKMESLAKDALEVVNDGKVKFHPERWTKTYNHWLDNIQDWCISRQLIWGHRIPVWYCRGNDMDSCQLACKEPMVSIQKPDSCACGSTDLVQDPDVLDTWFSSWLWPFATLGWPQDEKMVQKFYPTQDLVTGPDIIFFWVARMIMAGLYVKKEIPFSNVYFTGIVRDEQGRKMSKSLGNSPDPLDLIEKFGADALRVGMLLIAPQGLDILFAEERIEQGRNFMNKLWNSARFVTMNIENDLPAPLSTLLDDQLDISDKWILSRLNKTIQNVNNAYSQYKLNEAVKIVYDFVWSEYCDWYIELAKVRFYSEDDEKAETARIVSVHVLRAILKLLHPYTPFITEKLWKTFSRKDDCLLISSMWPESDSNKINDNAENEMKLIMATISTIRNIRSNLNVSPSRTAPLFVRGESELTSILKSQEEYLERLVKVNELTVGEKLEKPAQSATGIVNQMELFIPLKGLIDIDHEVERLEKQIADFNGRLGSVNGKLNNENFVARAPESVVANEKRKQSEYVDSIKKLEENLKSIQGL